VFVLAARPRRNSQAGRLPYRAVHGERADFIANLEPSQQDFLDIDTTNVSVERCVQKILQASPAGDSPHSRPSMEANLVSRSDQNLFDDLSFFGRTDQALVQPLERIAEVMSIQAQ